MFSRFSKKDDIIIEQEKGALYAPLKGKYIGLDKIPDEVFAKGILGKGCGIVPTEGKVVSPVDGEIVMVADTKHALGIKAEDGETILIHIGLETVSMKGKGFDVKVKAGEKVRCGQLLMEFNLDKVKGNAASEISAFIISDLSHFNDLKLKINETYQLGEKIGMLN